MDNSTGHSGNDIQRDAQHRMEQMQQKVPYRRQRNMRPFYWNNGNNRNNRNTGNNINSGNIINSIDNLSHQNEQDTEKEFKGETSPNTTKSEEEKFKLPFGIGSGLEKYIENLDTDKILIIALLAMIYKDGGNKKLMMALAYLLT